MTGQFEFDDVIATAKVIVHPEQSAAELKRINFAVAGALEIFVDYFSS